MSTEVFKEQQEGFLSAKSGDLDRCSAELQRKNTIAETALADSLAQTFAANKISQTIIAQIEERDIIECRGPIPKLVKHSFMLQMDLLSL